MTHSNLPASIEQMAANHIPDLIRLANRILGSADDAEEVVQASFLEVLSNQKKLVGVVNLAGFLRRIVTCRSLDVLRKRGKTQSLDFDPQSQSSHQPESIAIARELFSRLRVALGGLSPRQAEIFTLRYLSEVSNSEIAEQIGISENAVAVSLRKARIELQALIEKE